MDTVSRNLSSCAETLSHLLLPFAATIYTKAIIQICPWGVVMITSLLVLTSFPVYMCIQTMSMKFIYSRYDYSFKDFNLMFTQKPVSYAGMHYIFFS